MSRGPKTTTLYHPETGTAVEVETGTSDEPGRAEALKERGYLTKKPNANRARRPAATSAGDNSGELAAKDAEIERLRAELDAATKPADPAK